MPESGSTIPLVQVTSSGGVFSSILSVLSASSGLVQVSGGVASASSGITQAYIVSTSAAIAPVTSSYGLTVTQTTANIPTIAVTSSGGVFGAPLVLATGGITQVYNVSTAGAVGPVTSSLGVLITQTTASIPTIAVTSSGGVFGTPLVVSTASIPTVAVTSSGGVFGSALVVTSTSVRLTEGAGIAPRMIVATTVSKVSSSAGNLWTVYGFSTGISGAVMRLYNATTANVVMGSNVLAYVDVDYQSSTLASVSSFQQYSPLGMNFGTACSLDIVLNATSTLATAPQCFVTYLFR